MNRLESERTSVTPAPPSILRTGPLRTSVPAAHPSRPAAPTESGELQIMPPAAGTAPPRSTDLLRTPALFP
jgi:hypothetical protein